MKDWRGRDLNYLRISLTERCNLKCIYCREESSFCQSKEELTLEELSRLMHVFVKLGINKVRLTGGEPLIRKDITEIVRMISTHPEIRDIAMTTNGLGLKPLVSKLSEAGLKRINISMDSLQEERYREMTRGGELTKVLEGINAAMNAGLGVKINVVLVRGKNDSEVDDFIRFAKEHPLDVRFIELMPFSALGRSDGKRISNESILQLHPELYQVKPRCKSQPSEDYAGEGFLGRVGFISPISHKFCDQCNRVRLTSDGKLRMCLGQNSEIQLKKELEDLTCSDEALYRKMYDILYWKPERNAFEETYLTNRNMNQIGG